MNCNTGGEFFITIIHATNLMFQGLCSKNPEMTFMYQREREYINQTFLILSYTTWLSNNHAVIWVITYPDHVIYLKFFFIYVEKQNLRTVFHSAEYILNIFWVRSLQVHSFFNGPVINYDSNLLRTMMTP